MKAIVALEISDGTLSGNSTLVTILNGDAPMLFDEVTAALDPEMVREVLDVMLELARQGKTMIIVTHEMQFAKAIADRIIFLDGGKIVEENTPDKFFENPESERARKFLNIFEFEL